MVLSTDRSRDYSDPPDGTPGTVDADLDWDDDYDLWIAGLEWWRKLDECIQISCKRYVGKSCCCIQT